MDKVFSGSFSFSKANPFGLAVMLIAVLVVIFAGKLSKATHLTVNTIKIIGAVICASGALLAILG